MAGGSNAGDSWNDPDKVVNRLKRAAQQAITAEVSAKLAEILNSALADANNRDIDLVGSRIDEVTSALGDVVEAPIKTLFGGSVAKHTYVDGLSDIDTLLVLDGTEFENKRPSDAIKILTDLIENAVPGANAKGGKLAVTITYGDGMEIQMLPAFQQGDRLRVPKFSSDEWSDISPLKFQNKLTDVNQACGGKVVPTIKLAKAIMGGLPETQRLSGYHTESLAIEVFKKYDGTKTPAAMLPHFFEQASKLVLSPIKDSTGQSVHVDDRLGSEDSKPRRMQSHVLNRLYKRLRNAAAHGQTAIWDSMLSSFDD
ncbi:CBASS oligonucleotide cyclase [Maricaulis sp.]|uniref:CBASS oligonucleotide cyclase n=1 Tax=Maricaulis sp. TaxID=1486257 RepID=UPI000C3DA5DA|nr:CBASS oligonucleotide cyclase [Maricaulis sp.]MAC89375.1 nucleotidyltransferase [Maricaulis sp.]